MMNISAGDSKMQKTGFGPLLKGFKRAKFNDLESVKKIISKKLQQFLLNRFWENLELLGQLILS